jgi:hypothetical protein
MDSRITNSFLSDLMQQNKDITNVYTGVYILDTLRWASGINLGYGLGIIPLNTPPLSVLDMPGGIISSNTNIFTPQRIGFYPINGLST